MDFSERTLAVVRSYYISWTSKDFETAVRLLADDVEVEVPVNEYLDATSFGAALTAFGGLAKKVELLGEFVRGREAVLLYDMMVPGVGTMRVAEHFTVAGGKIIRLRQIHDTAPLRAAGLVR